MPESISGWLTIGHISIKSNLSLPASLLKKETAKNLDSILACK